MLTSRDVWEKIFREKSSGGNSTVTFKMVSIDCFHNGSDRLYEY